MQQCKLSSVHRQVPLGLRSQSSWSRPHSRWCMPSKRGCGTVLAQSHAEPPQGGWSILSQIYHLWSSRLKRMFWHALRHALSDYPEEQEPINAKSLHCLALWYHRKHLQTQHWYQSRSRILMMLVCKQLPICTSSRYRAQLAFISHLCPSDDWKSNSHSLFNSACPPHQFQKETSAL